jgi:hypothetical protein
VQRLPGGGIALGARPANAQLSSGSCAWRRSRPRRAADQAQGHGRTGNRPPGRFRTNSLNGGVSALLASVPVTNLAIILIGMPLFAAIIGWLLADRQRAGIARPAID